MKKTFRSIALISAFCATIAFAAYAQDEAQPSETTAESPAASDEKESAENGQTDVQAESSESEDPKQAKKREKEEKKRQKAEEAARKKAEKEEKKRQKAEEAARKKAEKEALKNAKKGDEQEESADAESQGESAEGQGEQPSAQSESAENEQTDIQAESSDDDDPKEAKKREKEEKKRQKAEEAARKKAEKEALKKSAEEQEQRLFDAENGVEPECEPIVFKDGLAIYRLGKKEGDEVILLDSNTSTLFWIMQRYDGIYGVDGSGEYVLEGNIIRPKTSFFNHHKSNKLALSEGGKLLVDINCNRNFEAFGDDETFKLLKDALADFDAKLKEWESQNSAPATMQL